MSARSRGVERAGRYFPALRRGVLGVQIFRTLGNCNPRAFVHPRAHFVNSGEWDHGHRQALAGGGVEEIDVAKLEAVKRAKPCLGVCFIEAAPVA